MISESMGIISLGIRSVQSRGTAAGALVLLMGALKGSLVVTIAWDRYGIVDRGRGGRGSVGGGFGAAG